jgi:hypothetical protein
MKRTRIQQTIALVLALSMPASSYAACLNTFTWRWWSNLAFPEDHTAASIPQAYPQNYAYSINQAAATYLATDLTGGSGPSGEGKVEFYNINFGYYMATACARTWSGPIECTVWVGYGPVDRNNCFPSILPADRGMVTYNDWWLASPSVNYLKMVSSHELGHIWGISHADAVCYSFMVDNPTVGVHPTTLQPLETTWINATY